MARFPNAPWRPARPIPASRVHRAGIQGNCHASGDVAIDMALTAVERAQRLFPRAGARPKITHCTLIGDGLVRRIEAAGSVPAPFPTVVGGKTVYSAA